MPVQGTFLFAMVWSIGASTGNDGRKNFDLLLREIIHGPLKEETKSGLCGVGRGIAVDSMGQNWCGFKA